MSEAIFRDHIKFFIALGISVDILEVLLVITQEHEISFHFFELFSIRNIIFNV